ncbi:MAG TPA: hypothetical protein VEV44_19140 [Pseudoneobacillus sp.]|nr:hypothetical protein [Pseudoneobacillus sp.]
MKDQSNLNHDNDQSKGNAYQKINNDIPQNENLKNRQPTPQPKDFDEIEY